LHLQESSAISKKMDPSPSACSGALCISAPSLSDPFQRFYEMSLLERKSTFVALTGESDVSGMLGLKGPGFVEQKESVADLERQKKKTQGLRSSVGADIKTKIICTLGPSTQSVETIKKLLLAGMNVARLNFSHGSHEYHAQTIANVRKACAELDMVCAIMLDTKGPEIRTGKLKEACVELKSGQTLHLVLDDPSLLGDAERVYVDFDKLATCTKPGDRIKIDDGLIVTEVVTVTPGKLVVVTVINGGALGSTKGVNLPGCKVDIDSPTPKDVADLTFGVEQDVDFVALSFTRHDKDVQAAREVMGEKGAGIKIVCKIENREGLDNFDGILDVCDGVMVARGDLGVEIPLQQVIVTQKILVAKCNARGVPVIVATQMLESMISNPRPTRAETTDVANAVFDGADCVMLSGETAKGDYPVEAVQVMARICKTSEFAQDYHSMYENIVLKTPKPLSDAEALSSSAVKLCADTEACAILVPTVTGQTATIVSKYCPSVPIIAVTDNLKTAASTMIHSAITPFITTDHTTNEELVMSAMHFAHSRGWAKAGDKFIVVHGVKALTYGIATTVAIVNYPGPQPRGE
jgi:pyruvate kinase